MTNGCSNGGAAVLLVALLVAALVVMVPIGIASAQADDGEASGNDGDVRPGEQLAGVVGVQGAELDGEMEARAFGIAMANATSDEARADVVAAQLERNDQRVAALEGRQADLREQRDAGEVSEGEYRARVAITVAEGEAVRQTTGQSAAAAADLPDDLREERGIDAEAIATLQDRADELTGPEVAEIARSIAGDGVGKPVGVPDQRPDRGGAPASQSDAGGSAGAADRSDRAGDTSTPTPS